MKALSRQDFFAPEVKERSAPSDVLLGARHLYYTTDVQKITIDRFI